MKRRPACPKIQTRAQIKAVIQKLAGQFVQKPSAMPPCFEEGEGVTERGARLQTRSSGVEPSRAGQKYLHEKYLDYFFSDGSPNELLKTEKNC